MGWVLRMTKVVAVLQEHVRVWSLRRGSAHAAALAAKSCCVKSRAPEALSV